MKAVVNIKCPYCERSVNKEIGFTGNWLPASETRTIFCNPEDGGCDREYAVGVNVKATVNYYHLSLICDD